MRMASGENLWSNTFLCWWPLVVILILPALPSVSPEGALLFFCLFLYSNILFGCSCWDGHTVIVCACTEGFHWTLIHTETVFKQFDPKQQLEQMLNPKTAQTERTLPSFSKVDLRLQLDLNLVLRRFVLSPEGFISSNAGWEQSLTI